MGQGQQVIEKQKKLHMKMVSKLIKMMIIMLTALFFECKSSLKDSRAIEYKNKSLKDFKKFYVHPDEPYISKEFFFEKNIWDISHKDSCLIIFSNFIVFQGKFSKKGDLKIPKQLFDREFDFKIYVKHRNSIFEFNTKEGFLLVNKKQKSIVKIAFLKEKRDWLTIFLEELH